MTRNRSLLYIYLSSTTRKLRNTADSKGHRKCTDLVLGALDPSSGSQSPTILELKPNKKLPEKLKNLQASVRSRKSCKQPHIPWRKSCRNPRSLGSDPSHWSIFLFLWSLSAGILRSLSAQRALDLSFHSTLKALDNHFNVRSEHSRRAPLQCPLRAPPPRSVKELPLKPFVLRFL